MIVYMACCFLILLPNIIISMRDKLVSYMKDYTYFKLTPILWFETIKLYILTIIQIVQKAKQVFLFILYYI